MATLSDLAAGTSLSTLSNQDVRSIYQILVDKPFTLESLTGLSNYMYGRGDFTTIGSSGDDVMVAYRKGVKTFTGGTGNDTYVMLDKTTGMKVVEAANGGFDTIIRKGASSITLENNVEALIIRGESGTVKGNDLGNVIRTGVMTGVVYGMGGDDLIRAPIGSPMIDGGAGTDTIFYAGTSKAFKVDYNDNHEVEITRISDGLKTVLRSVEFISFADKKVSVAELLGGTPMPVAKDDVGKLSEDGHLVLNVLANDTVTGAAGSKVDTTLRVVEVGTPLHGTATLNTNGQIIYTPTANYNGPDSFTYTIVDVNGNRSTAKVNLTVDSVNDAPVAMDDTAKSVQQGDTLVILSSSLLANDKDTDGDKLNITSVKLVSGTGQAWINSDGNVAVVGSGVGKMVIEYTVSDGSLTDAAVFDVNVTAKANTAPVAKNDAFDVNEDVAAVLNVLANDTDANGDKLTVTSVGPAAHGTAVLNTDGTVSYKGTSNYNGADSFTYTISDGKGGTSTATATLNVKSVNDAPVAGNDAATVDAGKSVIINVLANDSDIDGDTLSVSSFTQGTNGSIVKNSDGTFTYTPKEGFSGSDFFTYVTSDGKDSTATATVSVTVNPVVVQSTARDAIVMVTNIALALTPEEGGKTYSYDWGNYTVSGTDKGDLFTADNNGSKVFAGGAGNDVYYQNTGSIEIVEKADEGFDILRNNSGWAYAMVANLEGYYSADSIKYFVGNELDNVIVINGDTSLNAGAGDDIVLGGFKGGAEGYEAYYDGGEGSDTLVLNGAKSDYKFEDMGYSISRITDLKTGATAKMANFEKVAFADVELRVDQIVKLAPPPTSGGPYIPGVTKHPDFGYTLKNGDLLALGPDRVTHLKEVAQASQAGEIVGLKIENNKSTSQAATFVTTNQVFQQGDLKAGEKLVAKIGSATMVAQVDAKTFYADGSVKMAVITFKTPAIAGDGSIDVMLAKTTAAQGANVNITTAANSYDFAVKVTLGSEVKNFDVDALLKTALANGTASTWMSGPNATQVRFDVPVKDALHLTFDVTAFADGTFKTSVNFRNDITMGAAGGAKDYDVVITQNGSVVLSETGIHQLQYTDWRKEFTTSTPADMNIIRDIAYLIETGMIHNYDLNVGINNQYTSDAQGDTANSDKFDILGTGHYMLAMGTTGGRTDIGPTTGWDYAWLLTQDANAAKVALAQASVAGSIPWHFFDKVTGQYLSLDDYSSFWADGENRGKSFLPGQTIDYSVFQPDTAHMPDVAYTAYLMTGDRYFLDQLNAQATWAIMSMWNAPRQDGLGLFVADNQVRGAAWSLRVVSEAAYANPVGSEERDYYQRILDNNLQYIINKMPEWNTKYGELHGIIPGAYGDGTAFSPWQQDFFASAVIAAARMGNEKALTVLEWMSNFLVGRFLHTEDGFDPAWGVAYNLPEPTYAGNRLDTWSELADVSKSVFKLNPGEFPAGYFTEVGLASLSGIISLFHHNEQIQVDAIKAFSFLVTGESNYAGLNVISTDPFGFAPELSNGENLMRENILNLKTDDDSVIHTNKDVNQLLFEHGTGNSTLIGDDGINILYGGSGNNTLVAGNNQDGLYGNYMFGGAGNDTLKTGTGKDYMEGGTGADIFEFTAGSITGKVDKIADFNKAEGDKIDISNVLEGFDPLHDAISGFIKITQQGQDMMLSIDKNGGGDNFVQAAILSGTHDLDITDLIVV